MIKYFITKSLNFVCKNISQRKMFRVTFVALDQLLKVSRQKSYFVAQYFPWWNKNFVTKYFPQRKFSLTKVRIFATKKYKFLSSKSSILSADKFILLPNIFCNNLISSPYALQSQRKFHFVTKSFSWWNRYFIAKEFFQLKYVSLILTNSFRC